MTRIIPFLETFWGLAEENPELRVKAAQSLLVHCFSESKSKADDDAKKDKDNGGDCAYALKRLLDGLNSGRASARQGFASCLSSFLRMAQTKQMLKEIRTQLTKSDSPHDNDNDNDANADADMEQDEEISDGAFFATGIAFTYIAGIKCR